MKSKIFLIVIIILAAYLRLYKLTSIPPALYWDEASIAYNAYSILKTGADEHGVRFPITHFLAFGDAKPPLYIYTTTVSMVIFGSNDFAVRFPSALAGIFTVLITFFLTHELFSKDKNKSLYSLIATLLIAISPWHLQMSRAAYEANLALTFFLAGLLFFLKGRVKPKYWILSAIFFIATTYTFNAYRIFLFFFLPALGLIYKKHLKTHLKTTLFSCLLASLLIAPLIPFALSDQAQLRFEEVTIFKNLEPIEKANLYQSLNHYSWWSRIIYNRRVQFVYEFLRHYTDHFKPDFLFFSGDVNPRLSVRDIGAMYLIDLPLLVLGIYLLIKHKNRTTKLLLFFWILTSIIPAGTARETPHALRTLQTLPAPQIIVALGLTHLFSKRKIFTPIIVICYLLFVVSYLEVYYLHYPSKWADSWQYGYKQLFEYIEPIKDNYDRIYITDQLGRPHTYTLWYLKTPPLLYWQTRDSGGDAFGFTFTNSFDKYFFTQPHLDTKGSNSWLLITTPDGKIEQSRQLHTIYNLQKKPVFVISEI